LKLKVPEALIVNVLLATAGGGDVTVRERVWKMAPEHDAPKKRL